MFASAEGVAANFVRARAGVVAACLRAGRAADAARMMVVSKTAPPELVAAAYAAGARLFGENRLQEGVEKQLALAGRIPAGGVEWRLIGHLQSNKITAALRSFDGLDALDSAELAVKMEKVAERTHRLVPFPVMIEVNIGREPQKTGIAPEDLDAVAETVLACRHLRWAGLMAIPPAPRPGGPAAGKAARPYFDAMRELWERWRPRATAPFELSLGMSQDFEEAIAAGSTVVRLGTAIFRERPHGPPPRAGE